MIAHVSLFGTIGIVRCQVGVEMRKAEPSKVLGGRCDASEEKTVTSSFSSTVAIVLVVNNRAGFTSGYNKVVRRSKNPIGTYVCIGDRAIFIKKIIRPNTNRREG